MDERRIKSAAQRLRSLHRVVERDVKTTHTDVELTTDASTCRLSNEFNHRTNRLVTFKKQTKDNPL
jgi:hypothetical protein